MNGSRSGDGGRDAAAVGWYGKLPGSGDFVTRRLPHAFLEPWDLWLRNVLTGSRTRLGEDWRDAFLSMPAWRFVLDAGVAGDDAWAGLLAPSVDAVGRYFPLTAACALPARDLDPARTLWRARSWYDELQSVVLDVLSPDADRDAFDRALSRLRFDPAFVARRSDPARDLPAAPRRRQSLCVALPRSGARDDEPGGLHDPILSSFAGPITVWLAEDSEIFGRSLLYSEHLPGAEQFCALMNGKWAEHGWRTDVPAAADGAGDAAALAARESV